MTDYIQLPHERDLEFRLLTSIVFGDDDLRMHIEGMTLEHFTAPETKSAFSYIQEADENGREVFSSDPPFIPLVQYIDRKFVMPHQIREATERLQQTKEMREAYLEATTTMKAVADKDVDAIRELRGFDKLPINLHPWYVTRRSIVNAYEERQPREYAVKGVIQTPSLGILYGRPGGFKTMLAVSLGTAIATGQTWLTQLPDHHIDLGFETTKGIVLYIDFDNGRDDMDEKVEAIARGYNLLPNDDGFIYFPMPSPRLNAMDMGSVQLLAKLIHDEAASVVILDNLGLIGGGAEENSADMATVMGNLRWLSEETRCAVLIIHHERKSQGSLSRRGESLRGHSSIEASLSLALQASREDNSDLVQIYATKVRGAPIRPFQALWTYEHKDNSTELKSARFFGIPMIDDDTDFGIEDSIIGVLEDGEMNKTQLVNAVHEDTDKGINRIRTLIDKLHAEGKLQMVIGKRHAKMFSLPK